MHSLLLLNGSPRGQRGNSMKMLARVGEGWQLAGGAEPIVLHLAGKKDFERSVELFARSGTVLLGMPLYADSTPWLVKEFLESVAASEEFVSAQQKPILGFLVQSGFSEALHSRPVERYLAKLATRLGSGYAGTIVHGSGESLQVKPEQASNGLWKNLRLLGGQLAAEGHFQAKELQAVAGMERLSPVMAGILHLILKTPLGQFYWNGKLKRNGAWTRRFAMPYEKVGAQT